MLSGALLRNTPLELRTDEGLLSTIPNIVTEQSLGAVRMTKAKGLAGDMVGHGQVTVQYVRLV